MKFHNGDPVTAEDVKFSFERYRGIFARGLKDNVADVISKGAQKASDVCTGTYPALCTQAGIK